MASIIYIISFFGLYVCKDDVGTSFLKINFFFIPPLTAHCDAVIPSTAHSKMVGGKCTHTDCVMDSGCSFPITSTAVAEAIGAEVMPLTQKLEIIDASNRIMEIIGTIKMYINNDVLGGRKFVEAAVTRSNKKETLISLSLLKKWDWLHDTLPYQTISDVKN